MVKFLYGVLCGIWWSMIMVGVWKHWLWMDLNYAIGFAIPLLIIVAVTINDMGGFE